MAIAVENFELRQRSGLFIIGTPYLLWLSRSRHIHVLDSSFNGDSRKDSRA